MNSMLTLEEVKNFLQVSQDEVEALLKSGRLNAYKIGGSYIRFRKEEVESLRQDRQPAKGRSGKRFFLSRIADIWRFNNFYIVSAVLIGILIFLIAGR
ncbi:MAG: helix-turn-helix domain-containing protein [Candidatus Omnitrophica bacterium]|nr:helix-turn-helix domain-containing protein [Candidatus Omnitrophota bacterium]